MDTGRMRPLALTPNDAWALQQFVKHDVADSIPEQPKKPAGYTLRQKVNAAIIQFTDEPGLATAEVNVTEEELWLIDRVLPIAYDGAREFLVRVFRCLWELEFDITLERVS